MEISKIITSTTSRATSKATSNTSTTSSRKKQDFKYDCDELYEMYSHLCGDSRFKPYYTGAFYKLGKESVMRIASMAKSEGKDPARVFGIKIKQALKSM